MISHPWYRLQSLDKEQEGDDYHLRIQKISDVNVSEENGNHNHNLRKRSPIDPNSLWQKPLFEMISKIFEKKKKLKLIKSIIPFGKILGLPKAMKFGAKQLKFDILQLGSKIPI